MTLALTRQAGDWQEAAAQKLLGWLSDDESKVRTWVAEKSGRTAAQIADDAVEEARRRSGASGFIAGFADFLGIPGFTAAVAADIFVTARMCVEMGQRIALAHGHDIGDEDVQVRILDALAMGSGLGSVVHDSPSTMAKKAFGRYFRHAVKNAGMRFVRRFTRLYSRRLLFAWLPLVGSVVNMKANKQLMSEMGGHLIRVFERARD